MKIKLKNGRWTIDGQAVGATTPQNKRIFDAFILAKKVNQPYSQVAQQPNTVAINVSTSTYSIFERLNSLRIQGLIPDKNTPIHGNTLGLSDYDREAMGLIN